MPDAKKDLPEKGRVFGIGTNRIAELSRRYYTAIPVWLVRKPATRDANDSSCSFKWIITENWTWQTKGGMLLVGTLPVDLLISASNRG